MTRVAGQRPPPRPGRRTSLPHHAIAGTFLMAVVAGTTLGPVPQVVAIAYLLGSIVSFVLYACDKSAAGTRRRRTPENTLHAIDFLGGWPGALVAQHWFRHKTAKPSFQLVFWITVVANLAVMAWLMGDDRFSALVQFDLLDWAD